MGCPGLMAEHLVTESAAPSGYAAARRVDAGHDAEVAAIRGLLGGLGLGSIIDVHTHFMPKRVMEKVWAYFDQVGR